MAEILEYRGLPYRLVSGVAVWAVDTATGDIVVSEACAEKNWPLGYVWLETGNCVVDGAARCLPDYFAQIHAEKPFSALPGEWLRFPETIVHPLETSRVHPYFDEGAAYGYWNCDEPFLVVFRSRTAQFREPFSYIWKQTLNGHA